MNQETYICMYITTTIGKTTHTYLNMCIAACMYITTTIGKYISQYVYANTYVHMYIGGSIYMYLPYTQWEIFARLKLCLFPEVEIVL